MEFWPSSDRPFIGSKGSFIRSQGCVVKNISNDDSDPRWVETFRPSFISHEMFYCDPSSNPRGDCCPRSGQNTHLTELQTRTEALRQESFLTTPPPPNRSYFHTYFSTAVCGIPGTDTCFQRAARIKCSPTFGNGYGIRSSSRFGTELHERRTAHFHFSTFEHLPAA